MGRNQPFRPEIDLTYRSDIDGLRAIAVLAVILYHTGFPFVSGGYVGVDVFFVISGYLISQRLLARLQEPSGRLGLKEFYVRRIRRLFPAMACTVLLTLATGFLLSSPDEFLRLARSAVAATFSASNILFYLESGYWDAASESKPLLHTWSLAVEEQFYLIWPFVMLGLARLASSYAFTLVLSLLVLITLATVFVTSYDQSAAFYLTPFRIPEFLVGSACVWMDRLGRRNSGMFRFFRGGMFICGVVGIGASVVLFDDQMAFPGWLALLPSLATALVILARMQGHGALLLTNPASRFLGLTSYSLYLVHWPVLVFARQELGAIEGWLPYALLVAMLVLATIQYYLVESPLRRPLGRTKQTLGSQGAFLRTTMAALPVVAIVSMIAGGAHLTHGFSGRFSTGFIDFTVFNEEQMRNERFAPTARLCRLAKSQGVCGTLSNDRANVIVVGDSHAVHVLNTFSAANPSSNYLIAQMSGCIFRMEGHSNSDCENENAQRRAWIEHNADKISKIVIGNRLTSGAISPTIEAAAWAMSFESEVIVFGSGPEYQQKLPDLLVREGNKPDMLAALTQFETRQDRQAAARMTTTLARHGVSYIDPMPFFCPEGQCNPLTPGLGAPITTDEHHLSLAATNALAKWLVAGGMLEANAKSEGERWSPPSDDMLRWPDAALFPNLSPGRTVYFDGAQSMEGSVTPIVAELTGISVEIESLRADLAQAVAYSDTYPPMPFRSGDVALYVLADHYKLRLREGQELRLQGDSDGLRIDIVSSATKARVYVNGRLVHEHGEGVAFHQHYRLGAGFKERYWTGAMKGFSIWHVDSSGKVVVDFAPLAAKSSEQ